MRKLTIKDFSTAREYEEYKRSVRKADVARRQSPVECRKQIDWNNV